MRKQVLFILIVILFSSSGYNCLFAQEDMGCVPSITSISPGIFLQSSIDKNQKSINIGIDELMDKRSIKDCNTFLQLNILNYNWIQFDNYNNNKLSSSYYLSAFNLAWILGSTYIHKMLNKEINSVIKNRDINYLYNLPIILTNSQIDYNYITIPSTKVSIIHGKFILKTNLNYFENDNSWWQYKIGIGTGLQYSLKANEENSQLNLSLNFGYEKPFNLISHKIIQQDINPFIQFKINYTNITKEN